jgi:DNA polymerase III epsilon subunit family exonuclease
MKESYVVLDIETTGLSKHAHRITEIGAIKIENSRIKDKFHTLVNPQTLIPPFITSLTGIDNNMVKDSPPIKEVMPQFKKFLECKPLVGHCVTFDYGFLDYNSQIYLSQKIENLKICTRKLSRRLVPDLKSYKLSSLCEKFNINNSLTHRAMSDVQVTYKIFKELIPLMQKRGINNVEHIINFQNSKIPKY